MAIYRLLKDTEFAPENIAAMTAAFHAALKTLGVADSTSPMAVLIAKNIVDVARRGERDPVRLYEKALGPSNPLGPTKPLGSTPAAPVAPAQGDLPDLFAVRKKQDHGQATPQKPGRSGRSTKRQPTQAADKQAKKTSAPGRP